MRTNLSWQRFTRVEAMFYKDCRTRILHRSLLPGMAISLSCRAVPAVIGCREWRETKNWHQQNLCTGRLLMPIFPLSTIYTFRHLQGTELRSVLAHRCSAMGLGICVPCLWTCRLARTMSSGLGTVWQLICGAGLPRG